MALRWEDLPALLGTAGERTEGLRGPVARVECRPSELRREDLFCAFEEFHGYQHWWSGEAIFEVLRANPPVAVVGPPDLPELPCATWRVERPAVACAHLARAFHGAPSPDLPVVGVTGTNGKTTTVRLLAHLWNRLGVPAADMGTLGTRLAGAPFATGEYTTDLAIEVHRKLGGLQAAGARAVAMEVSSHGLALERVAAVPFAAAVMTNVTRDHLEFHGSENAYRAAKRKLFEGLAAEALAVLNVDDPVAAEFAGSTAARVVTYGRQAWAELRLREATMGREGSRFTVEWQGTPSTARTALVGEFQLHNVLAAAATLLGQGQDPAAVWGALEDFQAVTGRMERLPLPNGGTVVIDYAHNPDGLEQVLRSCRAMGPRRLVVVFGCGGDRDRGKRPLMGAIAEQWADGGWITSDNPRTEDPAAIVAEVVAGIGEPRRFPVELDRAVAIEAALAECGPEDVLLIAGKGHEDYQIVGTEKRPFSDHAVVRSWAARSSAPSLGRPR